MPLPAALSSYASSRERQVDVADDDDSGAGDLSLSAMALSSSSSSTRIRLQRSSGAREGGTTFLNDARRISGTSGAGGGSSYDDHPFRYRPAAASRTAGASTRAEAAADGEQSDRDPRRQPKPQTFAASRDSLLSAASGGAYYSAEEDIADRPASHGSNRSQDEGRRQDAAGEQRTSPSGKSSKRAGKARQRDPPPSSPVISPRKGSLAKPAKPARLDTNLANQRGGTAAASTAGSSSSAGSESLRGGDLAATSPGMVSLAPRSASASREPTPRRSSRGLSSPSLSSAASNSRRQSSSCAPTSIALAQAATGLGLDLPPEADLGARDSQRFSLLAPENYQSSVETNLLQRWILSVGCVNFDLEKGPDLESLSPPLDISKEEKDNIAFSSFPDTSIFDVGDTVFSFRVREVPLDASVSSPPHFGTTLASRRGSQPPTAQGVGSSRRTSHTKEASESAVAGATSGPAKNGAPVNSEASSSSSADEHQGQDLKRSFSVNDLHPGVRPQSSFMTITNSAPSHKAVGKVSNSSSSSYLYGYTFFRQKRDSAIRRGYFQKSLVILTHLPYVALFSDIVSKLGPLYFDHGESILESFCSSVTKWPNPSPGATLPLPLFGSVLWAALPLGRQSQSSTAADASETTLPKMASSLSLASLSRGSLGRQTSSAGSGVSRPAASMSLPGSSEEEPILASIPLTPLVSVFKEALADMWMIWECVLLAEPILVMGPDPRTSSEAVWHLLDICRPIPHAGDFRPFFTIHDYDFKNLATRKQPPAGTIIGCTNPFLAQACAHWPHVLRVGKAAVKLGTAGRYGKAGAGKLPVGGGVGGGTGAGGGGPEHLPGFATKRKRRVSKDRPLLKKLQDMVEHEENIPMANAMLRRYFADITERFLAPLNRYISSLIPPEAAASGGPVDSAKIRPFNTDAFLASLKAHGTPLPLRSRSLPTGAALRQGLYLDFLRSPNFSYYLTERITYYRTRNPVPSSAKTRFEH
ncbi:unnamed protein product [Parajaminaea phylloscopi]